MKKIVFFISILMLSSSATIIKGFKAGRGSLLSIEVARINPKTNKTAEPWLVKTALSTNPKMRMGLSSVMVATTPNELNTIKPKVMISKSNKTYVMVYKKPDTSQAPIISIIEPEMLPKIVTQDGANDQYAKIIDTILAVQDDGTVLLMDKKSSRLKEKKESRLTRTKK